MKLQTWVKSVFGDDYRTTISGHFLLLCAGIYLSPDLIAWIPNEPTPFRTYIHGICGLLTFVFGSKFALEARDKKAHIEFAKKTEPHNTNENN